MNRPLSFASPLSPPDCVQRLQKLVERKHYYFSSGYFGVVHVMLDSLETSLNSFTLFFNCSTRGRSVLPFIYLRLAGELESSENETSIQLLLQADKPRSTGEWLFLGLSLFLLSFALAGGVIGVLTSPPLQGIFISLIYVLAGIGGLWVHRQTYKLSAKNILILIYHTLQHAGTDLQSQNANEPAWLSSLSKSQ